MNAILKWVIWPEIAISYQTVGMTPDKELRELCAALQSKQPRAWLAGVGGQSDASSVQRKLLAEATKNTSVAVLTDDRLVRGLVTAVSWLGVNIKPFPWERLPDAVEHLKLSHMVSQITTQVTDLRATSERINLPPKVAGK